MANKDILINILGDDKQFQQTIRAVKAGADSLKSVGNSFNLALGAIGGGLSLDYIIKQNVEAQKSEAALAQAVKLRGDTLGYTTEQLKAYAQELQKTTGFSANEIEQAQALAATYTHIGHDVFPQLIQGAADLATRMGIDLNEAVKILGKSLNDPIQNMGALKRVGLDFSKTQQQQIAYFQQTNQLAKAQAVILGEVQKVMGGAAQNAGDLGTQLKGLANDFGDDVTGGGGVSTFTESVKDLRKTLQDPEVKAGFQGIASFFMTVVSWAVKAAGVIAQIGQGLGTIAGFIGSGGRSGDAMTDIGEQLAFKKQQLADISSGGGILGFDPNDPGLQPHVKRLKQEIAQLQASWDTLVKGMATGTSSTGQDATKPGGVSDTGQGVLLSDAQLAFDKVKAETSTALAALDQAYKDHSLTISEYYQQRLADEQKSIDAEIALKQIELAQAGEDAQKQAQIQGDIIALQEKRKKAAVDAVTAEAEANRKLQDVLQQVRDKLTAAGGDAGEAAAMATYQQYKDTLTELQNKGDTDGVGLIAKLIDVEAAKASLAQLQDQINTIFDRLAREQQAAQDQQTAGILTPAQAAQAIVEANQAAYDSAGKLIPQMQQLADIIGDPKAAEQVAATAAEIEHLKYVTNQYITQIAGAGEDALSGFFDNLLTGTMNLRQAFQGMVQDFAKALAQMESQIIAHQLVQSFLNYLNPYGGTTTSTGSSSGPVPTNEGPRQYAGGGEVHGPGTGTSDSISARLSRGEFVVKAASVRQYGTRMLHSINQGFFPSMPSRFATQASGNRFAGGGLVSANDGGGIDQVVINNYTGQQSTTETRQVGNKKTLIANIGQAAAADVLAGGPLAGALQQVYGVQRKPGRRGNG